MAIDPDADPWPRRHTAAVGKRIAHYRRLRSFKTTAQLSARCGELGHRIEPQVIANMESGRRGNVPSAELAVLAAALEVPVYLLTIPLGSAEPVEVLPGRRVSPWTAYRLYAEGSAWSSVVGGFPTAVDHERGAALLEGADVLAAYREHDRHLTAFLAWRSASEQDPHSRRIAQLADANLGSLVRVRDDMRTQGWALPDLPSQVTNEVSAAEKISHEPMLPELGDDEGTP